MKTKKNPIFKGVALSVATMLFAVGMIGGATLAIFTDKDEATVAITSGTVDVSATLSNVTLYSPTLISLDGTVTDDTNAATDTAFANGGTAELNMDTGVLTLTNVTPGDRATFTVGLTNTSNVKILYRLTMYASEGVEDATETREKGYEKSAEDDILLSALTVTIDEETTDATTYTRLKILETAWSPLEINGTIDNLEIGIEFPAEHGNEYHGGECQYKFAIEAVQGNTDVDTETTYTYRIPNVKTSEELAYYFNSASTADSMILGNDIMLESRLSVIEKADRVVDVDLNGYTLTGADSATMYYFRVYDGTLNMYNGTLNINPTIVTQQYVFFSGPGANGYFDLTHDENVNINLTDLQINIMDENTRTGSVLLYGDTAATGYNYENSSVTMENVNCNVEFGGGYKGVSLMYFPAPDSNRTLINCTFTGDFYNTIVMCGGSLTVEGGTYSGYVDSDICYNTKDELVAETGIASWSNFASTGDAIFVCNNRGENYTLGTVSISDATFIVNRSALTNVTDEGGYGVRYYDHGKTSNGGSGTLSISGTNVVKVLQPSAAEYAEETVTLDTPITQTSASQPYLYFNTSYTEEDTTNE